MKAGTTPRSRIARGGRAEAIGVALIEQSWTDACSSPGLRHCGDAVAVGCRVAFTRDVDVACSCQRTGGEGLQVDVVLVDILSTTEIGARRNGNGSDNRKSNRKCGVDRRAALDRMKPLSPVVVAVALLVLLCVTPEVTVALALAADTALIPSPPASVSPSRFTVTSPAGCHGRSCQKLRIPRSSARRPGPE